MSPDSGTGEQPSARSDASGVVPPILRYEPDRRFRPLIGEAIRAMAAAALMLSVAAVSLGAGVVAIFFRGNAEVAWMFAVASGLIGFGLFCGFVGVMNVVDAVIWLRGCNLPKAWWYRAWEDFNGRRHKRR